MGRSRIRRLPLGGRVAIPALMLAPYLVLGCGGAPETSAPASASTTSPEGALTVRVAPRRVAPGGTVEASVVNATGEQFTYGAAYELERRVGANFEAVKLPPRPVIEIGYVAPPGGSGPSVRVRIPDDARPGTYRVVIQRDVPSVGDLSGEFEVSNPN